MFIPYGKPSAGNTVSAIFTKNNNFAFLVLLCVFCGALLFLRKVTGEYESEFKIAFG